MLVFLRIGESCRNIFQARGQGVLLLLSLLGNKDDLSHVVNGFVVMMQSLLMR